MTDAWLAKFTENGQPLEHRCFSLREALHLVAACENPAEVADAVVVCPDGTRLSGAELVAAVLGLSTSQ